MSDLAISLRTVASQLTTEQGTYLRHCFAHPVNTRVIDPKLEQTLHPFRYDVLGYHGNVWSYLRDRVLPAPADCYGYAELVGVDQEERELSEDVWDDE